MLSWDDQGPRSIVSDDGYGDDEVHEVCFQASEFTHMSFRHRASL